MPSASPFHTLPTDNMFEAPENFYPHDPMMPSKQSYAEPAPHQSDLDLVDSTERTYATLQTPGALGRQGGSSASTSSILDLSMARREDCVSPIPSPTGDRGFLSNIFSSNLPLSSEGISEEHTVDPNWKQTPPRQWTKQEVVDWVYHVVKTWDINPLHVHGEKFNELTGRDLCTMSPEDFKQRDGLNGQRFYDCFQDLLKQVQFEFMDFDQVGMSPAEAAFHESFSSSSTETDLEQLSLEDSKTILPNISHLMSNRNPILSRDPYNDPLTSESGSHTLTSASLDVAAPGAMIDYDTDDKFHDIPNSCDSDNNQDSDGENYNNTYQLMSLKNPERSPFSAMPSRNTSNPPLAVVQPNQKSHLPIPAPPATLSHTHQMPMYTHPYGPPCHPAPPTQQITEMPQKRRPGRPRKIPRPGDYMAFGDGKSQSKPGRKQGTTSKGTVQLWKFVRDLLLSNEHNPRIIRWEDKDEGVFRIVCSEEVAKMWGDMKNNPSMTYEKMSRAMRFCRDQEYFAEVPKDKNFPKKLCFRFGKRATGWQ